MLAFQQLACPNCFIRILDAPFIMIYDREYLMFNWTFVLGELFRQYINVCGKGGRSGLAKCWIRYGMLYRCESLFSLIIIHLTSVVIELPISEACEQELCQISAAKVAEVEASEHCKSQYISQPRVRQ